MEHDLGHMIWVRLEVFMKTYAWQNWVQSVKEAQLKLAVRKHSKHLFKHFFFKVCRVIWFSTLSDENLKKKRALHILLDRLLKLFKCKKKNAVGRKAQQSLVSLAGDLKRLYPKFTDRLSKSWTWLLSWKAFEGRDHQHHHSSHLWQTISSSFKYQIV